MLLDKRIAKKMIQKGKIIRSLPSQRGASLLEYSLLAALISLVLISVITVLGNDIDETFRKASEGFAAGGVNEQPPG